MSIEYSDTGSKGYLKHSKINKQNILHITSFCCTFCLAFTHIFINFNINQKVWTHIFQTYGWHHLALSELPKSSFDFTYCSNLGNSNFGKIQIISDVFFDQHSCSATVNKGRNQSKMLQNARISLKFNEFY